MPLTPEEMAEIDRYAEELVAQADLTLAPWQQERIRAAVASYRAMVEKAV